MLLLSQLSDLASWAVARVRSARIPVTSTRAPGPRPTWPWLLPAVEMSTGSSTITLKCDVPGATRDNTLVVWDEDASSISIRVARAAVGGELHDWYVEHPLPANADGMKSECTLEAERLQIHVPLSDTPAGTGLLLRVLFQDDPGAGALACA
jgi:hypothetical protein